MIEYKNFKFTGKIDRRSPFTEGDPNSPIVRENFISRDGRNRPMKGTEDINYYSSYTYDSYTKLNLLFKDTFKDELGNIPTAYGDARIDKTDGSLGSVGCGIFGGTDGSVSYPDSADWYFGTGDFAIDIMIKFSSTAAERFVGQTKDGSNVWWCAKSKSSSGNKLQMYFVSTSIKAEYNMTNAWSGWSQNVWYHLRFVRNGATALMFIDGIAQDLTAGTAFGTNDVGDIDAPLDVGGTSTLFLAGKIGALRISKGTTRGTENFEPITSWYGPDVGVTQLTTFVNWMGRYYSGESGVISPKTLAYTRDGKLWYLDDVAKTIREVKEDLNLDAFPRHVLFKLGDQNIMYFVDGKNLFKYDGNNDYVFEEVDTADAEGDSIEPLDLIEHKDRLILLTKTHLAVSKNLAPDVYNDATDSIHIIVGSGQGRNVALGKIEDRLYIFNTEGIFALVGDTISALAITFEIRKVDDHRMIAGRSLQLVEGALVGIFDDYNLWSWNGSRVTKLSHEEKLEEFLNRKPDMLVKMVSVYEDNFYKLSFTETGTYHNNLEIWYDAFTQNIDFARGRNVNHYLAVDKTREEQFYMFAHASTPKILFGERGAQFDKSDIILRLKTRNIIPHQGRNVRFYGFYPEIEPVGTRYITITYLLDGRLGGTWKNWSQVTTGETVGLGFIQIQNQTEVVHRVRPQIKYSRGHSIAFDINIRGFNTTSWGLVSLGMEYIPKARLKGRGVSK